MLLLALFRVSSSSSSLLSLLSINNFPLLLSLPQISIRPLLSAGRAMFFLPLADDGDGGRKDSEDGSDVLGADTSRGAAANTTVSHYSTTTMYWWSSG